MMKQTLFSIILILLLVPMVANSQKDASDVKTDQIQSFYLQDGSILIGSVDKFTQDSLRIQLQNGSKITVANSDTRKIKDRIKKRDWRTDNFGKESGYIINNGFPIGKEQVSLQNFILVFNKVTYGISDRVDLTAGFEIISAFDGDQPGTWLGAKFAFPVVNRINAGISTDFFLSKDGRGFFAGLPITVGSERNFFTVVPTYATVNQQDVTYTDIVMQYNLRFRLANWLGLSIESFTTPANRTEILDLDKTVVTANMDFYFRSGLKFSLGIFTPEDEGPIPCFGFYIPLK